MTRSRRHAVTPSRRHAVTPSRRPLLASPRGSRQRGVFKRDSDFSQTLRWAQGAGGGAGGLGRAGGAMGGARWEAGGGGGWGGDAVRVGAAGAGRGGAALRAEAGGAAAAALRAEGGRASTAPQGAGVLLLHPHPALGGNMHFPPVEALFHEMVASPAFDLVVRYNMRGAGGSGGRLSLWGGQDMADLREVSALLHGYVARLYLVGYSWGSCVAAGALGEAGVAGYVGVSFPAGWLPSVFLGARRHLRACLSSPLPKFFLHGTRDNFTSPRRMRGLTQRCSAATGENGAHGGTQEDLSFLYEEWDTDHFWYGREGEMACSVRRWIEKLEVPARPGPAGL